jgi:hypothetical protein
LNCSEFSLLLPFFVYIPASIFFYGLGSIAYLNLNKVIKTAESTFITPILIVGLTSLLGLITFWLYYLSPIVGIIFSYLLIIWFLAEIISPINSHNLLIFLKQVDIGAPLLLIIFVGLLYQALIYLGSPANSHFCWSSTHIFDRLVFAGSPDYLIQFSWVELLYSGQSPWNVLLDPLVARTTLADRPPLLAGTALILDPIFHGPGNIRLIYFLTATSAASLSWITAIWGLCRLANLSILRTMALCIALSFVYYFLFSSVFTWPKSLSGALTIGAILFLLDQNIKSSCVPKIIFWAILGSLSIMAHFSSALVLGFSTVLIFRKNNFPKIKNCLLSVLIFVVILSPYMLVKMNHETTNSQLAKYTFTGEYIYKISPEKFKQLSTLELVYEFYLTQTSKQIQSHIVNNIKSLFRRLPCLVRCENESVLQNRSYEIWQIFGSLKFFNLGWLFLPFLVFNLKFIYPSQEKESLKKIVFPCLIVSIFSILSYALVAYAGGITNILSSGLTFLLFGGLGILLFSLPWILIALFSFIVISNFFWLFILNYYEQNLVFSWPVGIACIFCLFLIFILFFRLYKNQSNFLSNS